MAGRRPPEKAESQLNFGVQMAQRGLWSEALFRFKQAYRNDSVNPKTLNNLAVAYEALGRFDLALDFYQKAIRADPSNKEMKRNYSRFVEFYRNFRPDDQKVLREPEDDVSAGS
jgi:tetratricopeptide (TPR) repeat protein